MQNSLTMHDGLVRLPCAFLPDKIIRGLHRYGFPIFGNRLYRAGSYAARNPKGEGRVFLRVDDFPRWDLPTERFLEFHQRMRLRHVPYLLGVTPFLDFHGTGPRRIDQKELDVLRSLLDDGVELALHGFTHKYRLSEFGHPCETDFYTDAELQEWLERAFAWFSENGLPHPKHYIPPFNTFSKRDFDTISQRIPCIHGGPLSISTFGPYRTSQLEGPERAYFPCYEPFYNRAARLTHLIKLAPSRLRHDEDYWVTLHWSWEGDSDFRDIDPLLDILMRPPLRVCAPNQFFPGPMQPHTEANDEPRQR